MKLSRPGTLPALLAAIAALGLGLAACDGDHAGGRVVRVGLYDNAPKIYRGADGHPAGLFVEVLDAIARREGWTVRYQDCDWSACLAALAEHRLDLMPDVAFSSMRSQHFDFHRLAVAHSWSQILTRNGLALASTDDLGGLRIAALRDSLQEHGIAALLAGNGLRYQRVAVDSLREGFEAVAAGRADAVVANNFFAGWHNPEFGLQETPIVFQPSSLYFATARGHHADLLAAIDRHLGEWRADPGSPYFDALRRALATPGSAPGAPAWMRWAVVGALLVGGLFAALAALLRWRVQQRTAELRRSNERLEHLIDASPAVLFVLRPGDDGRHRIDWVSGNVRRIFGFDAEQVVEADGWMRHILPEDQDAARAALPLVLSDGHVAHEYRLVNGYGETRHVREEMQHIATSGARAGSIIGTWSDLTQTRHQEARLSFLATHDTATGLPGRGLLRDRIVHALQRAELEGRTVALLFLDLNRFKHINDTLGHLAGDNLLLLAAQRLSACLRADDTLARVGGDEFAVLLEAGADARHASLVAEKLLAALAQPIEIAEHRLVVTACVGISVFPDDSNDADRLLMHAELAMTAAKRAGNEHWRLFDPSQSERMKGLLVLESALRQAIARNELQLHFQPQLDLASGDWIGVEALVRWNSAELGTIPPARFIPLAEEVGIIGEIDDWVLREACRQLMAWDRAGFQVPRVAVNLSVRELAPGALSARVSAALGATGLDPRRLELELTESTLMQSPEQAGIALGELKALGIELAVDDFGTGYSSLAYLKRLPIDRLKIDQSFVRDLGHSPNDAAIVNAVIALARSLGLATIAEGVESEAHANFLRHAGCDAGQGYLFSRPQPAAELERLHPERYRARPALDP